MIKKFVIAIAVASFSVLAAYASNFAMDNASNNPPYNPSANPSWPNGSNGGNGFGAWSFSNTVTTNGFAGQYVGSTGDGNPAFGLFASDQNDSGNNGNSISSATRPFTGGGLTAGQTFSFDLGATGSVYDGTSGGGPAIIGFNLLSGSTVQYTMKFTGNPGDTGNWTLNDGGSHSDFSSGIPFAGNNQVTFSFMYDGGNSYDVHITEGANSYSCVGCVAGGDVSGIDGVKFFDIGQGGGQNFGFNDLQIVPEPSTVAAGVLAVLGTFFLMRQRRKAIATVKI